MSGVITFRHILRHFVTVTRLFGTKLAIVALLFAIRSLLGGRPVTMLELVWKYGAK